MSTYRDHAVVLGSHKFGEADRVVVLLTRDHGKVRAVARGVRRMRSSIGARLEPMSHVDISLRTGRELDTVDQVRLVHTHMRLRDDLDRLRQGLAMVEAMNKVTPDRVPVPHLYELLSRALHALDERNSPVMMGAFFWRLMQIEGQSPELDRCVGCGESGDFVAFDMTEGGVQCGSCRTGQSISKGALGIIRTILGGRMNDALSLGESMEVNEANMIAMDAMEAHLERRIRSLGVFDRHL